MKLLFFKLCSRLFFSPQRIKVDENKTFKKLNIYSTGFLFFIPTIQVCSAFQTHTTQVSVSKKTKCHGDNAAAAFLCLPSLKTTPKWHRSDTHVPDIFVRARARTQAHTQAHKHRRQGKARRAWRSVKIRRWAKRCERRQRRWSRVNGFLFPDGMVCGFRPADGSAHTNTHSVTLEFTPVHTHTLTPEKQTNYLGNVWLLAVVVGKQDPALDYQTASPVSCFDRHPDTSTFFFFASLNWLTHGPERTSLVFGGVVLPLSPRCSHSEGRVVFIFTSAGGAGCQAASSDSVFEGGWWGGRKGVRVVVMQYGFQGEKWVGRRLRAYGSALCACVLSLRTPSPGALVGVGHLYCKLLCQRGWWCWLVSPSPKQWRWTGLDWTGLVQTGSEFWGVHGSWSLRPLFG